MKKIILSVNLVLLIAVVFAQPSFTSYSKNKEKERQLVMKSFHAQFKSAENINWSNAGDGMYRAVFTIDNTRLTAYYDNNGQLWGTVHNINSAQLPQSLQRSLRLHYGGYWIVDLFEVGHNEEPGYCITIENAERKIVLRAVNGSDWSIFRRTKK
jgi:hypothetical protein